MKKTIYKNFKTIKTLKITLASPDIIRNWSYGEVKNSETINYRTLKPENNGLFCCRIFGPIKDYECLCGKYRHIKYIGIICDYCGVEVTKSNVRRKRMGHIELAVPIVNILFVRKLPYHIGLLLNISLHKIEKILNFEYYIVIEGGLTPLYTGLMMNEKEYINARNKYGDEFEACMGAEAIKYLLETLNLKSECKKLRLMLLNEYTEEKKKKILKRLKYLENFINSGNKPEWMVLTVLPVLPPDLRPLVPLDGGRFASSDLNELYRRVINRNNRLKNLIKICAPEIILCNERRMLQESVYMLLDNKEGKAISSNNRPLKSLSDILKGKQGRFRQNLLGKRVDYSGRTVIIVGPNLKLHQCGFPKELAIELFKPFIYCKLLKLGLASNNKEAKKILLREDIVIWDILENIIKKHPILLNRAPTLHRLGIQGFYPILIEGKAIQLHPLVCTGYNADFDGDQIAVHIPLTVEAKYETCELMLSIKNILSPANGYPIIVPSQDIVLGLYYMTCKIPFSKGEGMWLKNYKEAETLYFRNIISLHANIKIRITEYEKINNIFISKTYIVNTTLGRTLLWSLAPKGLKFKLFNNVITKKVLSNILNKCYYLLGFSSTVKLSEKFMEIGFYYAAYAGISICLNDIKIPKEKKQILYDTKHQVAYLKYKYNLGFLNEEECYNKILDLWYIANEKITKCLIKNISPKENNFLLNSLFMIIDSGARGSTLQIRQLAGMRGLMAKPDGTIIENPITANFKEGLNVLQYFISTHGARKGLADTALKTANAGYLTRRLVDVSQDLIITEDDCGTKLGKIINNLLEKGNIYEMVLGRFTSEDLLIPGTNKILIPRNVFIDNILCKKIEFYLINCIKVRTVVFCNTIRGVCAHCYGIDLSNGKLVKKGVAIGVIAAQSIGEPGTQLTMRTFHIGGTASHGLSEYSIKVKNIGYIYMNINLVKNSKNEMINLSRNTKLKLIDENGTIKENYKIPYGAVIYKKNGNKVNVGDTIASWDAYNIPIITEVNGYIKFIDLIEGVTINYKKDEKIGYYIEVLENYEYCIINNLKPSIKIIDKNNKDIMITGTDLPAQYFLPGKSIILLKEGDYIINGDIIANISRKIGITKDITGGLYRVSDLFEARIPKKSAILIEKTGILNYKKDLKGKRKFLISSQGDYESYEEIIPKYCKLNMLEGSYIRCGEILINGPISPHDVLRLNGINSLIDYILNEVKNVYLLQGVKINEKHIEVIIHQMLRKVTITQIGGKIKKYMVGDQLDYYIIKKINDFLNKKGKLKIIYLRNLLGITKASLITDSFISAASFQETTRILTEAAVLGKKDKLHGLKENVILGRLIPAGTGYVK